MEEALENELILRKEYITSEINGKREILSLLKESKNILHKALCYYMKKWVIRSFIATIISIVFSYLFNYGLPVQSNVDLLIMEFVANGMVSLFTWTAYTRDTQEARDTRALYTQQELEDDLKQLEKDRSVIELSLKQLIDNKKERKLKTITNDLLFSNALNQELMIEQHELEKRLIFTLQSILKKP